MCSWVVYPQKYHEKLFIHDVTHEEVDEVDVSPSQSFVIDGLKLQFDMAYVFQIGNAITRLRLTSKLYYIYIYIYNIIYNI